MRICTLPNTNGEKDSFECYEYQEFPYEKLTKLCMKNANRQYGSSYMTNICSFDIETTTLADRKIGYMYQWQLCIDGMVVYGRYWKEFEAFLGNLRETLGLCRERILAIYVHNLGFEFQHMKDFMERAFEKPSIFAAQPRKPIRLNYESGFEFRCSWKLSNMSLDKFLKNEKGVDHLKQKGDLDYKVIRTPETVLTDMEFSYCIADVVGLYEAIKNRLINEHDNLETIPMTSTSYVRRDCRKATQNYKGYRDIFHRNRMTENVYILLKTAARGGDTHANRFRAGLIIEDVHSYDVQSSYPAMMLLRKFPMTSFVPYGEVARRKELEDLLSRHACLFRLTAIGISVKDNVSMPYVPDSKCQKLAGAICDNGRVLSAEGLSITITDIDYAIIKEQYDIQEEHISEMHIAEYGYLPEPIIDTVMEYFRRKTRLKSKIGNLVKKGELTPEEIIELSDLWYNYNKSKNRLNGIFGMCFTDPVHDIVSMQEDGTWTEERPDDITASLEKYHKSRNSFLVYAWGVWVTCHARQHLARLRKAGGEMCAIYQDTDSNKGAGLDHEAIERENILIRKECEERGAYCDVDGERYYLGVYEWETRDNPYQQFKTLGAKKYCYTDNKGLHVTVSGVSKESGAKELGNIERFKPGFIFREAGGMELVYNQSPIHEITVEGITFETASNIAMLDSTYMLGASNEYMDLIGLSPIEIIEYQQIKERVKDEKTKRDKESRRNKAE